MSSSRPKSPLLPLLLAAVFVAAHVAASLRVFRGDVIPLGNLDIPTRGFMAFTGLLVAFGLPVVACLALAGTRALSAERLARWSQAWCDYPERRALLWLALGGVLVPLLIQSQLLHHAPLTDDEASYQLQARLMASFRLWVPSPPMKLFFDNAFLVNDGKLYSQYFLGWPFLLAFGMKVGLPWLVNPLLAGATVVAVFLVARDWFGSAWARVAGLLYLASPMGMMGAATQMAHTAELFALAWLLYFVQRSRAGAGAGTSALVAFFFCLAFWTRPATGIGLGAPLLGVWAVGLGGGGRTRALARAGAFLAVAVPLAALFLVCNDAMNGSPWTTGYHAVLRYARDNDYRFVTFAREDARGEGFFFFILEHSPLLFIRRCLTAAFRLCVDGFGWPVGLAIACLARGPHARWLVASLAAFWLVNFPLDSGVDTFGPVHYSEAMLPLVLLTTDGLRSAWRWSGARGLSGLVPGALAGLLLTCATLYLPPRWITVFRMAQDIRAPLEFVEENAPDSSIIFTHPPIAPRCHSAPAQHFVFTRPNNGPDFDDPVLWANHLGVARDRELVRSLPGRKGFLLAISMKGCQPELIPLDRAPENLFPPAVKMRPSDFPPAAP